VGEGNRNQRQDWTSFTIWLKTVGTDRELLSNCCNWIRNTTFWRKLIVWWIYVVLLGVGCKYVRSICLLRVWR